MARKVSENHVVSEQETGNAAEELIKQQNAGEEFVMGEEVEEKTSKPEEAVKEDSADSVQELVSDQVALDIPEDAEKVGVETEKKAFSGTVVLTGASTYLDSGTRYVKNVPVMITDRRAYEHLIKTGLFVRL